MNFKTIILGISFLFCLMLQSKTSPATKTKILEKDILQITADLDNDNNYENIMLIYGKGFMNNSMLILNKDNTELLWKSNFKGIWKIQIADFDKDGIKEIVSGVWKFSPVYQKNAYSISVHNWENNSIIPKWRGSTMSKSLVDFITSDINNDGYDELITIEKSLQKPKRNFLVIYKWNDFGFIVIKQYKIDNDIFAISQNFKGEIFLLTNKKEYYQIEKMNFITGKEGKMFRYKSKEFGYLHRIDIPIGSDTITFYKKNIFIKEVKR